jgi:hypothetical protein
MIRTTPAPEGYPRFSCPPPPWAPCHRPGPGTIAHRSWTDKASARLCCPLSHREVSEREGPVMARSTRPAATVEQLRPCQRWGGWDEGTADRCGVALKPVQRGQPMAAPIYMKLSIDSLHQCDGFVLFCQTFSEDLSRGVSFS